MVDKTTLLFSQMTCGGDVICDSATLFYVNDPIHP